MPVVATRAQPLCVDLDGTLIRSDTLVESALALLKRAPWMLFAMVMWLLGGKARLKAAIAARQPLDASRLPYRAELVQWLREQAAHRPVYLATAAHRSIADDVARHLAFFTGVFSTDRVNLSSGNKAQALAAAFGDKGFDYIGNDHADIPVWRQSAGILVVGASAAVSRAARRLGPVLAEFDGAPSLGQRLRLWVKALRLYQWVKNLLVLVAPVAGHVLGLADTWEHIAVAFLSFGLAASAIYLLNDLLDLEVDRAHPRKRNRPFAAGTLPVMHGLLVSPVLLAAAFALGTTLGGKFILVLVSYVAVTTLYSGWIKQKLFFDVAALAWLYTVRVVAGAVAVGLPLSSWLLSVSGYGFLCLALVKRFAELASMERENKDTAAGRAYRVQDMPVVMALGCAAGLVASLVMALYVDSTASHVRYSHPIFLWALSPLLMIGMGRLWLIAGRGHMHDDPIVFVVKDKASLALAALAGLCIWAAI